MPRRILTTVRLVLGIVALSFAMDGVDLYLAATLITLSIACGGLARQMDRRAPASDPFGVAFASLVRYLTVVVVPWVLVQALLIGRRSLLQELLLWLPLVAGAVQIARATVLPGAVAVGQGRDTGEPRGLDPVLFAFVSVTAVFLRLQARLSPTELTLLLSPVVAVLSGLMLAPLRYPALTPVPAFIVLLFAVAMPFVMSEALAAVAIVAGLVFIILAPLMTPRRSA